MDRSDQRSVSSDALSSRSAVAPSSQAVQVQGGNVIVVTRVRPLNKSEIQMGTQVCLTFNANKKDITLNLGKEYQGAFGEQKFTFDRIFDLNSTQKEVYDIAAKPIIDSKCLVVSFL